MISPYSRDMRTVTTKTESIEEFLKRGGRVTKCQPSIAAALPSNYIPVAGYSGPIHQGGRDDGAEDGTIDVVLSYEQTTIPARMRPERGSAE